MTSTDFSCAAAHNTFRNVVRAVLLSTDRPPTMCILQVGSAKLVRGLGLIGRRGMLKKALRKGGPGCCASQEHLSAEQGEGGWAPPGGIVSKKLTSRYKSGSCKSWLKVKNLGY
jgi:hypothetical protein